jgi:hypothetical protein
MYPQAIREISQECTQETPHALPEIARGLTGSAYVINTHFSKSKRLLFCSDNVAF